MRALFWFLKKIINLKNNKRYTLLWCSAKVEKEWNKYVSCKDTHLTSRLAEVLNMMSVCCFTDTKVLHCDDVVKSTYSFRVAICLLSSVCGLLVFSSSFNDVLYSCSFDFSLIYVFTAIIYSIFIYITLISITIICLSLLPTYLFRFFMLNFIQLHLLQLY